MPSPLRASWCERTTDLPRGWLNVPVGQSRLPFAKPNPQRGDLKGHKVATWSFAGARAEVGQVEVQNVELRSARWGQKANRPWGSARVLASA